MININCDLGEGLNNEHVIMPLINSCNIACGGHAGDSQSMIECVEISIKNEVEIGAHTHLIQIRKTSEEKKLIFQGLIFITV